VLGYQIACPGIIRMICSFLEELGAQMKKIIGLLLVLLTAALIYIFLQPKNGCRQEQGIGDDFKSRPGLVLSSPQKQTEGLTATQTLARCIVMASSTYGVPADVVIGIMYVEGGHRGQAVGPNVNGTYDLGIMQVNSLWVPKLALLWQVDNRTAYNAIRDSGCENIYVGAWILKQSIAETGTLYDGIAYYHSATRGIGAPYADKVLVTMKNKGLSLQQ